MTDIVVGRTEYEAGPYSVVEDDSSAIADLPVPSSRYYVTGLGRCLGPFNLIPAVERARRMAKEALT